VAAKYSLEAVFKLIDRVTAPTSKIDKALAKLGIKSKAVSKALKNDFNQATEQVAKLGKSLARFARGAVLAGAAAAGAGLAVAVKQFSDYDSAVTAATAKFKDVDVTSDTFGRTLKEVGKVAREVAAVTEYNAVDTAGALDKMAMAGLTSVQSMKLLMGTTNLATAAGTDLTTAVDIATDALGAFQMMSPDEDILTSSLDRLSDVMAKTTIMFNTDMAGMYEAIKKGAPTFASAGQQVEDFSALIGALASSGIKGSEAGTQLRNIMLALANPTGEAAGIMTKLGIVTKDAKGNFLNIIDIIGQFEQKTKAMGSAQKAAALSTLFGTRAVTGMNIMLAEGADRLRGYRTELVKANELDATKGVAEAMRGSIKNKLEVMKSALTELGFKFIDAFQTKGVALIERITGAIERFNPQPAIDFAVTVGNVLAFTFKLLGGSIKLAWKFRHIIIGLAIAWGIYRGMLIAALAVGSLFNFIQAVNRLRKAQQGMNIAQAVFNVLMSMNPIGLVITAIGILIGLIVALVKNWDAVTAAIGGSQAKIMGIISIFTGPFGYIISIIKELIQNWGLVSQAFNDGGIFAAIKKIGAVLLSGLLTPVQGLLEILSNIPGLGHLAGKGADKIQEMRNALKDTNDNAITKQNTLAGKLRTKAGASTVDYEFRRAMGSTATVTKTVDAATPDLPVGFDADLPSTGTGASGKNPLHGVYDISGKLPSLPSSAGTATAGVSARVSTGNGAPTAVPLPTSLLTGVADIAACIRRIDTGVAKLVGTRATSALQPPLPALSFENGGDPDGSPAEVAPITQGERMAYVLQERRETVVIEVSAAKGTSARVIRAPPDVDIRLVHSGGNE
jgi:TP901 family phage tail tape measure protein